jgi:hypothetical protein
VAQFFYTELIFKVAGAAAGGLKSPLWAVKSIQNARVFFDQKTWPNQRFR